MWMQQYAVKGRLSWRKDLMLYKAKISKLLEQSCVKHGVCAYFPPMVYRVCKALLGHERKRFDKARTHLCLKTEDTTFEARF